MKITPKYNSYNQYQNLTAGIAGNNTYSPTFGISFRPKLLKDMFTRQTPELPKGILNIKNVHAGEFGTECKGSLPLPDFEKSFGFRKLEKLYRTGYSTNIEAWANCLLKSTADRPLSTSSVHDCSVLYLYNNVTNTHFLYHTYYDTDKKGFEFLIKTFMPEGYTKADIVPGDAKWHVRHGRTLLQMFKALKDCSKTAPVNVYHDSSRLPEIVGYKGNVYEIPNIRTSLGLSDEGQASFRISDIQINNTIGMIAHTGNSSKRIYELKNWFESGEYDEEVSKILFKILDERLEKIQEIENCFTNEDLKLFIKHAAPQDIAKYSKAIEIRRAMIQAQNIT